MATKTYSEKLRDPRWQRKRLEVMQRDDFACQFCEAKDKTLNVHHVEYIKGREPWEYDNLYLITVCEECHKFETDTRPSENETLLSALASAGLSSSDVNAIAVGFMELSSVKGHAACREIAESFSLQLFNEYKKIRYGQPNGKD